jgi:D-xylonolactonase
MEIVASYNDLCGECPVWDPMSQSLYWTDCVGLNFYRYDASSKRSELVKAGLEINGFRLNNPSGFVITNNSGIWLWDGADNTRLIADHVDGNKCQMNDCVADAKGRLFSGSLFYNPEIPYPKGHLMRVGTDGKVSILDEGFDLSNGLAFSPDFSFLYFADSVARRIYRYDYDLTAGTVSNRRTLVQVPSDEGLPDGLAVDVEGFIWSAQWYGGCVVRYDPDGRPERRIVTPAKQTSSVGFGDTSLTTLFITSAARSEPMPVMPPGYDPDSGHFGGELYRTIPGVAGVPLSRAEIRL